MRVKLLINWISIYQHHKSCQLYCERKQYLLIPWVDILWYNYDLIYCYQFDLRKKHFVTPVFFPWSEVQGTELFVAHCNEQNVRFCETRVRLWFTNNMFLINDVCMHGGINLVQKMQWWIKLCSWIWLGRHTIM